MTSTFLDWIRSLNWANENVRGAAYAALKLVARFFRKLRNRYEDEQGAGYDSNSGRWSPPTSSGAA